MRADFIEIEVKSSSIMNGGWKPMLLHADAVQAVMVPLGSTQAFPCDAKIMIEGVGGKVIARGLEEGGPQGNEFISFLEARGVMFARDVPPYRDGFLPGERKLFCVNPVAVAALVPMWGATHVSFRDGKSLRLPSGYAYNKKEFIKAGL